MADKDDDSNECKQYRPKYEAVISVNIMDGLKEFCDEFSCKIVPQTNEEKQIVKQKDKQNDDDEDAETVSMIQSLHNIIEELRDNLNASIVDIDHLQSAEHGLSS